MPIVSMRIGIFGAGSIGGNLGRLLANAGHGVIFTYVRNPEKLKALIESIGHRAREGTPREVARVSDVVFLAVPWFAVRDAIRAAGDLAGKILVDCTNPFKPDLSGLDLGDGAIAAKLIEHWARDARVVKAFNTMHASVLAQEGGRRQDNPPVVFYCGDDVDAKKVTAKLIRECGFEPMDIGVLSDARFQEPRGPLYNHVFRHSEAERLLKQLGLYTPTEPGAAA